MTDFSVETVVIGAGVVGLTISRELSNINGEILVLESETSLKANLAESLIAGVRVSIGPVKPKIIPTLISAKAAVEIVDKLTITARSNFFIFPPRKFKIQ